MTWHYRSFVMNKSNGRITQAQHQATAEAVEDFVNNLHPWPSGCQLLLSEGPSQRVVYAWVREGNFPGAYDYEAIPWTSADTASQMEQLLQNGRARVLIGFDGGRTQSIHYLRYR